MIPDGIGITAQVVFNVAKHIADIVRERASVAVHPERNAAATKCVAIRNDVVVHEQCQAGQCCFDVEPVAVVSVGRRDRVIDHVVVSHIDVSENGGHQIVEIVVLHLRPVLKHPVECVLAAVRAVENVVIHHPSGAIVDKPDVIVSGAAMPPAVEIHLRDSETSGKFIALEYVPRVEHPGDFPVVHDHVTRAAG